MSSGKLFQRQLPATGSARLPTFTRLKETNEVQQHVKLHQDRTSSIQVIHNFLTPQKHKNSSQGTSLR